MSEIRRNIINECVSYDEIVWLQDHVNEIPKDDTLLLQWAGVDEINH